MASLISGTTLAQETVKVGVMMGFTGPFALFGEQTKRGMEMYLDEVGRKCGNANIELIYRDEAGGPDKAKALTQELIVRDRVQFLTGFNLTPTALAIAPLVTEAKVPTLITVAGAGVITRRSPYIARVSFTLWQHAVPLAQWAANSGIKEVVIAYSDYAAGTDTRDGFKQAYERAGGKVLAEMAMPMQTADYGIYIQKIRDIKAGAVFFFAPTGPSGTNFIKTFHAMGMPQSGVKLITTAVVDEMELGNMGEQALGTVSVWHYSPHLDTPENRQFLARWKKKYPSASLPTFMDVTAYDGMHAICDVVRKLGPKFDGDQAMAALKGWKTTSARGPIEIDASDRDIVQNLYVRRVEKVPGGYGNVAFETIPAIKDPWKAANP
ncbi:MAG TPA: ABC transporter substrate-binding protein [Burkholderiales bacterium]|nr:ABC transporter substrate-binding protein [Burkholderiales bacterium]